MTTLGRTRFDARGQSGQESKAIIKQASYGNNDRSAQVSFYSRRGMRVWDSRDREIRERLPLFKIKGVLDIDPPARLTAKVGLAAGYFAYGDLFWQYVDERQLQDVM